MSKLSHLINDLLKKIYIYFIRPLVLFDRVNGKITCDAFKYLIKTEKKNTLQFMLEFFFLNIKSLCCHVLFCFLWPYLHEKQQHHLLETFFVFLRIKLFTRRALVSRFITCEY